MHFLNFSAPYLITYSSGSFASLICKTLISTPRFFRMSIPLKIAVCPAPSASYPKITFSAFLLSNLPCASVRAVPSDATTFVIPR